MAKGQNDPSRENDYLEQLQWRANHHRSVPVRFEPKWKYKIVYRFPPTTPFAWIMNVVILPGVVFLIIYFILSGIMSDQLEGRIFYSIVFGLIFTIIFFAVRDASKDQDDNSKHQDE